MTYLEIVILGIMLNILFGIAYLSLIIVMGLSGNAIEVLKANSKLEYELEKISNHWRYLSWLMPFYETYTTVYRFYLIHKSNYNYPVYVDMLIETFRKK